MAVGDELVGGVWCLSRSAFDTPPVGVLQVLGFHHSVVVVKKRPQLGGTPGQSVEDVQHERGSLSDSYRYVRRPGGKPEPVRSTMIDYMGMPDRAGTRIVIKRPIEPWRELPVLSAERTITARAVKRDPALVNRV